MNRHLSTLAFLLVLPFPLFPQASSQTVSQPSAPTFTQPALGQKLHINGIPNGGKISEVLYRGAQPRDVGLSELKILGVTTIVDLRGEDRQTLNWERQRAEALGMRFVQIPVSGWSPPTDEQLVQFLSLLRDNPGQKIFLHCRFGDDRTGVFVAAYRIALDHWTADQAIKEMYFFGFNGLWHPSMKTFVHNFPSRLNSAPALAPLRASPTLAPLPAAPAQP
jgi:protein tyrosine phosphatase (PTP) superfamily phosphohydrolase (DUF442 family)